MSSLRQCPICEEVPEFVENQNFFPEEPKLCYFIICGCDDIVYDSNAEKSIEIYNRRFDNEL